jgi:hypothetical protein
MLSQPCAFTVHGDAIDRLATFSQPLSHSSTSGRKKNQSINQSTLVYNNCTHEFLIGHGLFTVSLPLIIDYRMQAAFTGQLWYVGSNYLQANRLVNRENDYVILDAIPRRA